MSVSPGSRIGPYEIGALLGAGGMGAVYRARDTKLNRDVAIKVLAGAFAADPERLARFAREAQLLAALNHPGIAQIYGLEELAPAGDTVVSALVLELVDGPTLADRIAKGPVAIGPAVAIARQIAAALEAAHARGIVHRDLKPANIKVTPAGIVKVLDFGLAKGQVVADRADADQTTRSGGRSIPTTQVGAVLGTAAYMSPEQARALPADERSDLWALGVVLYEMLTGRRPFEGETTSDTIAAVLRSDIDWDRLPRQTPDELRRLVRRCLEREAASRLQDAGDARVVLTDLEREGPAAYVTRRPSRLARWLPVAAAALIAVATLSVIWLRPSARARTGAAAPVVRFAIEPPAGVTSITNVTLPADGAFVVFEGRVAGETQLFLRHLDALEARPLPGTEGGRWPFVSPDGRWVGFFRDGQILRVSTSGGDPLVVGSASSGPGAVWAAADRIVFSRTWLSGLSTVSPDGGEPTVITKPDLAQHEIGHWWPSMLPDGRILFTIATAGSGLNDARVALLDPATGRYRVLFAGARASWIPSGHLLFFRTGRYQVVRFDLATGAASGDAVPVLEDAQDFDPAGDLPQPLATAAGGTLAYLTGPFVPASRLTWIGADGAFTPLPFAPRPFVSLKVSPDERRVATASLEAGRLLLRLFDLQRGTDDLPRIAGMNWNPAWLPDGRLSFTSMRKGDFDVYVKDVDSAVAETALLAGPDDTDPVAWTTDGRLVLQGSEPDGVYPLKLFDPRQPTTPRRLTEHHTDGGSVSPDDRWLIYHTANSGRPRIHVRPLDGSAPAVALSPSTGEFPTFLRHGRQIAFVRGSQLLLQPWRDAAGRFETGPERTIAELWYGSGWLFGAPVDSTADGRILALVRTAPPQPPRIRVVLGWDRELLRPDQTARR